MTARIELVAPDDIIVAVHFLTEDEEITLLRGGVLPGPYTLKIGAYTGRVKGWRLCGVGGFGPLAYDYENPNYTPGSGAVTVLEGISIGLPST